jgi:hypothetical protein
MTTIFFVLPSFFYSFAFSYLISISFLLVYFLTFLLHFHDVPELHSYSITSSSKGSLTTGGRCVPGHSFLRMRRCIPFREKAYRDGMDCICLNSLSQARKTQCSGIPAVIELAKPLLCYTVH